MPSDDTTVSWQDESAAARWRHGVLAAGYSSFLVGLFVVAGWIGIEDGRGAPAVLLLAPVLALSPLVVLAVSALVEVRGVRDRRVDVTVGVEMVDVRWADVEGRRGHTTLARADVEAVGRKQKSGFWEIWLTRVSGGREVVGYTIDAREALRVEAALDGALRERVPR